MASVYKRPSMAVGFVALFDVSGSKAHTSEPPVMDSPVVIDTDEERVDDDLSCRPAMHSDIDKQVENLRKNIAKAEDVISSLMKRLAKIDAVEIRERLERWERRLDVWETKLASLIVSWKFKSSVHSQATSGLQYFSHHVNSWQLCVVLTNFHQKMRVCLFAEDVDLWL